MTSGRIAYACVTLAALTISAYSSLWQNDFVNYDDEPYLAKNRDLLQGLSGRAVVWAWTTQDAPYWQPVVWLSFLGDAQFFPHQDQAGEPTLSVVAVHGQNLFWHTLSAVLLFLLLGRLTGRYGCGFWVAALFAVHPMHVESVAWAIERKDVLCTFFGLLALWNYVGYVRTPNRWRYGLVLLAYSLSLLSKPTLITLPFLLLLLDYWPLMRFRPDSSCASNLPRLIREKLPIFLLATAIAALTFHIRDSRGSLVSLDALSLSSRLANVLASYSWYLSATFWPTSLAVLYPHPYENWSGPRVAAGAVSLLLVTALCIWQRRRQPWLLVGWLWFVIGLLPMTGLAQGGKQSWADRFSYWPHIGLFMAIVWTCVHTVEHLRIPSRVAGLVAVLILIGLGAMTWRQTGYWRTSRTLWEHALAVTEDNEQAHQFLSLEYRRLGLVGEAAFHNAASHEIARKRRAHAR